MASPCASATGVAVARIARISAFAALIGLFLGEDYEMTSTFLAFEI
jgi:hypothetical protein